MRTHACSRSNLKRIVFKHFVHTPSVHPPRAPSSYTNIQTFDPDNTDSSTDSSTDGGVDKGVQGPVVTQPGVALLEDDVAVLRGCMRVHSLIAAQELLVDDDTARSFFLQGNLLTQKNMKTKSKTTTPATLASTWPTRPTRSLPQLLQVLMRGGVRRTASSGLCEVCVFFN